MISENKHKPECKKKVINILRHLEHVHGWSNENTRTALVRFGIGKNSFLNPDKAPKEKKGRR